MEASPDEVQLLLEVLGAKNVIDVAVFTGYSLLATAIALPDDGKTSASPFCKTACFGLVPARSCLVDLRACGHTLAIFVNRETAPVIEIQEGRRRAGHAG
jgi:hypothetical protein